MANVRLHHRHQTGALTTIPTHHLRQVTPPQRPPRQQAELADLCGTFAIPDDTAVASRIAADRLEGFAADTRSTYL